MNDIEKFAKEHGAEYENEKTLAPLFRDAVQSAIGDKGTVNMAWTYTGSNNYGYVDWEASITDVDGMLPDDEIVIVLSTSLDDGVQWLSGRYMDDCDTIAEAEHPVGDGQFDPLPIVDRLLAEVKKDRGTSEAKKDEDKGADTSALLHLQTKGDGNEQAVHEFLDDLYLNNRNRLGGFVRIYSKDLGEVIGVYADSKKPEVLAEYLKLYAKEYIVRQDMHDGNWTEAVDVLPYILDCLQELVRKGGVPCKEQSNDTLVANGVSATVGENGTIYVKDRVSDHIDGCDTTEDAAKRFIALWQKHNLNKGESKKPESCKDGKKESMERCDSCGAVMTEYDYDRYGGLCKYCRDKGEAKKSEALTKDTIVVGQIFNSNLKWIERTLKQIKKKFPNVESNAFGNTLTIRGKLSDVSDVCDTYKTGSYMLCQDKGGDFLPNAAGDDLDDAEISKALSESKKSEGIGDRIKMGIDYNMFMRMCRTAAYLDEDEDYWDALWEYYSEMGEIEDALVFFDNLFQYTAWCDADELYDEYLDDKFKDDSKSKEECIEAAIDDGDLQAYKHEKGNYLVIL